jgi:hypothetical protein
MAQRRHREIRRSHEDDAQHAIDLGSGSWPRAAAQLQRGETTYGLQL